MVIVYKKWKKQNEIQLTKNKMNLNNQKMTNHPPSPVLVIIIIIIIIIIINIEKVRQCKDAREQLTPYHSDRVHDISRLAS